MSHRGNNMFSWAIILSTWFLDLVLVPVPPQDLEQVLQDPQVPQTHTPARGSLPYRLGFTVVDKFSVIKPRISENIIGALTKCLFFQYCDSNIGLFFIAPI